MTNIGRSASRWQWAHYALRTVAIVAGASIPAITAVDWGDSLAAEQRAAIALLSAVVAAMVGIDSQFRFRERWLHQRRVAEELDSEAWAFLALAKPLYSGDYAASFPKFATRFEALQRDQVREYTGVVMVEQGTGKVVRRDGDPGDDKPEQEEPVAADPRPAVAAPPKRVARG